MTAAWNDSIVTVATATMINEAQLQTPPLLSASFTQTCGSAFRSSEELTLYPDAVPDGRRYRPEEHLSVFTALSKLIRKHTHLDDPSSNYSKILRSRCIRRTPCSLCVINLLVTRVSHLYMQNHSVLVVTVFVAFNNNAECTMLGMRNGRCTIRTVRRSDRNECSEGSLAR